jgi:hypothetical protein
MNRHLETLILTLRNQKVLFDADLAAIYGVPTRALNQAVKRNARRFPADFVFRLTAKEIANLRAEWGAANRRETAPAYHGALRSQFVTLKTGRGQHLKYLPYAFTEHGALMGHMMTLAPKLAAQEGCNPYPDGGFRIVVNNGTEGGQEVHHLHMHVMGGPRPWLRG